MSTRSLMATAVLLTLLLAGIVIVVTRDSGQHAGLPSPLQMSRIPSAARPRAASGPREDDFSTANGRVAHVRFVANQTVRVAVLPAVTASVEIGCDTPYEIVEPGTGRVFSHGKRLASTRVQRSGNGFEIGRERIVAKSVEIVPEVSPGVWVNGHLYRGRIRLLARERGLMVVNRVALEDYVSSVINSEMPADFPDAARRAQAIVARTYAVYHELQAGPNAEHALFATVRSQKYLGAKYRNTDGRLLAGETERSRELTAETAGLVCVHRGELFCTYYCAVCGGRTVNGAELFADASPVLKSVPCDGCVAAERYRWRVDVPRPAALAAVEKLLVEKESATGVQSVNGLIPHSNRVGELPRFRVRGRGAHASAGETVLNGAELRTAWREFNLWSPQFSISLVDGDYRIEGRGHGHGAGLCQWGARGLAAGGWSAGRILRHYYPGCEIGRLPTKIAVQ